MKKIYLGGKKGEGKYALVDNEDYENLLQFSWHLDGYGAAKRDVHISGSKQNRIKKHYKMHRDIMNPADGMVVDHINHNPLDNRKANLRVCTQMQNLRNTKRRKDNTSGYKGVSFCKNTVRWQAIIWVNKQRIFLGRYENIRDAAKAYRDAALKYHGEFAYFKDL